MLLSIRLSRLSTSDYLGFHAKGGLMPLFLVPMGYNEETLRDPSVDCLSRREVEMPITSGYYKRYPVSGKALFQAESIESTGELVDISRGGMRIRSKIKPLEGEEIVVRFTLKQYSAVFNVRGMVVGVQSDSWAVLFFEEPVGLTKLLWPLDARAKKQAQRPIGT